MFVFPNSFKKEYLAEFIDVIDSHYQSYVSKDTKMWDAWEARTVEVQGHPIINDVIDIIESKIKIKLICHQAQIQIWPVNVSLMFHKHKMDPYRTNTSVYNSMLYLNDDFKGGEFITDYGVKIEPRVGTLTFFDGLNTGHGICPFYGNHRYTMIFWWAK